MRAILKVAALFPFFIAVMLFSHDSRAEDWFAQGLSAFRSHHYEKAIEAFSTAIEMNPRHVEAYNNRGITWFNKGDYDAALRDYNQALELDPRCAEAYNNRGIIWYYRGQYDLAIHDYDKALGIAPRFHKALSNRGAAWFCKGNAEMAIRDYKRALEINPNALETSQQLAWILSVYSEIKGPSKKQTAPQKPPLPPPAVKPGRDFKPKGESEISQVEPMKVSAATGPGLDRPGDNLQGKKNADESPDINFKRTSDPDSGAAFSIQVGAFASKEKAQRLTARLTDKGYDARVLPFESWSNKVLYAVRMGGYATRKEAEEKAAVFSEKEGLPAIVRPADEL